MGIRGERKAVARRVACDAMEMEAIHELRSKNMYMYISRLFQQEVQKKQKNTSKNK